MQLGRPAGELFTVLEPAGLGLQLVVLPGHHPRVVDLGELEAQEVGAALDIPPTLLTRFELSFPAKQPGALA